MQKNQNGINKQNPVNSIGMGACLGLVVRTTAQKLPERCFISIRHAHTLRLAPFGFLVLSLVHSHTRPRHHSAKTLENFVSLRKC